MSSARRGARRLSSTVRVVRRRCAAAAGAFRVVSGPRTLPVAVGVTAIALFAVGALLSLFTGRSALRSGARMLALGGLAGAVPLPSAAYAGVALG